jgi:hypothetical protein
VDALERMKTGSTEAAGHEREAVGSGGDGGAGPTPDLLRAMADGCPGERGMRTSCELKGLQRVREMRLSGACSRDSPEGWRHKLGKQTGPLSKVLTLLLLTQGRLSTDANARNSQRPMYCGGREDLG